MAIIIGVIGFAVVCAMLSSPADRQAGREFWRQWQWPLGIAAAVFWGWALLG